MPEIPGKAKWNLTPEALDCLLACFSSDRAVLWASPASLKVDLIFLQNSSGRSCAATSNHSCEVGRRSGVWPETRHGESNRLFRL